MQCLACHKDLPDDCGPGGNQPIGGLAFWTMGHYGALIDGNAAIEINVCNECIEKAAGATNKVRDD
jgi:hypothetical protein